MTMAINFVRLSSAIFIILPILLALFGSQTASTQVLDRGPIAIDPAHPARSWLAAGTTKLGPINVTNGLVAIPSDQIGWFDYDFSLSHAGWYRLVVDAAQGVGKTEFLVDPLLPDRERALTDMGLAGDGRVSSGWAWLSSGTHRLRVQNFFWTGFPQISALRFEALPQGGAGAFRLLPTDRVVFRKGACKPLTIEAGGSANAYVVNAIFQIHGHILEYKKIQVPASVEPSLFSLDLPCNEAGDIAVNLWTGNGAPSLRSQGHRDYTVFDIARAEPRIRKGRLVVDIDAGARAPDFSSCATPVGVSSAGSYRESGDRGSTPFIRRRLWRPASCWFAYRITGLRPGQPYIFEIEYPDDKARVFVAAFRDSAMRSYPPTIGVETGAIWPLSMATARKSAVVWPASGDVRAIFINVHDGMTAAVSHIRLYEADVELAPPVPEAEPHRDVLFWYEEGDNFRSLVGASHTPDAIFEPVDRYLSLARAAGATIVSPTAVIYNFVMYPSRFNMAFDEGGRDLIAAFLLGAERYGLKIVPQLHPRADELLWPPRNEAAAERRLLLSKDGTYHLRGSDGSFLRPPYYNLMNEDVRRWYIDMIGELADRYKPYPAFAGIDLRFMTWQNPALNNFVSLDWGYEAATVARFFGETGVTPPSNLDLIHDTPEAARARYGELTGHLRTAWIAWRCEKIRDLYRDISARVHAARPDLKLYSMLFPASEEGSRNSLQDYREAGLDPALLRQIHGLTLIDARFRYGAREADLAWRRRSKDEMMAPGALSALATQDGAPRILMGMQYIEITDEVASASQIGLPPSSKGLWISAASSPPGRLALERYATALGSGDPMMLGDGGNGIVFGGEDQRTFLEEFRVLPALPFERMPRVPDAIVLRHRDGMFYVVNMTDFPVSVQLSIKGPGNVRRMGSDEIVPIDKASLKLDLKAYEVKGFRLASGQAIVGVRIDLEAGAADSLAKKARRH